MTPTTGLSAEDLELFAYLLEDEGVDPDSQRVIPRRDPNADIPLSLAQLRMWVLDRWEPGNPASNIPFAVRLKGHLSIAAFQRSLNEIVRRHEALRTTFRVVNGQPRQIVAPSLAVPLPLTDLRSLPRADRAAEVQRLTLEHAQYRFDVEHGPLLRAELLWLADQEHVFLLNIHHAVFDAWSVGLFLRELTVLYDAFVQGRPSPLPELPVQYPDFAIWQRAWLQGDVLQAQLAYWKRQLGGSLPVLELPSDHPRPHLLSYQGALGYHQIPAALSQQLQALSQAEGTTLFMTLFAAFQTLLYRYTGEEDIITGSVIANRDVVDIEALMGFFLNTLLLRSDLSGNPTFRAFLQRTRDMMLGAYAHQNVPFEQLVEELRPPRDPSHTPLFQVMFVMQNAPVPAQGQRDLEMEFVRVDNGTSKFDLTLSLTETPDGLRAVAEYKTELFEAATIQRLLRHFQTLLEGVVADIDQRIAELPLLSEDERQQMLIDWNRSEAEYPRAAAVHELIEAQAARTPYTAAIVFAGAALTYAELNTRANQLAHYLRAQGVGPDVLVALCVERSLEMIVGMLAILKAGGAYVPLDPAYPQERLAYMLSHTRAPVILTQAALVARLPEHTAQVFCLDADWHTLAPQPTTNPPRTVQPEHLAYIIFTSGSTGRPKGVMVTQRGLINLVFGLRAYFDDPAVQTTGLITSISFDISVNQIFPTLFFGRTLHIIPDAVKLDSRALLRYLDDHQIHLLDAVPSYMQAVLNEVAPEQPPNALRYLLIGGEKIEQRLLQSVFSQLGPAVEIVNIYGLTEISDINLLGGIRAADLGQPITVGRPLHNNRIYILDQHQQPQPIGIAGEVCVSGASVSRGYLYRPDLTGERFVPCPFEDGQIMVRTGDLGRWRADGTVEILGRIDHQVKIRGFRIEPGEIEAVLRQHPAARDVVVLVREDQSAGTIGAKRLVAYVVGEQSERQALETQNSNLRTLSSELREILAAQLPDYMVPSAFVVLDSLPKTPSGKLDRRALPAPDRPTSTELFVGPRTDAEHQLAAIWAELLGLERVSVHDNFFALGGDSILSMQIIARASQAGLRLSPKQIFQYQTIAQLAPVAQPSLEPAAEQGIVTGPVPLTPIQHYFFALDLPEPQHFNQAVLLQVQQPLDPALLEQAVQHLVAHHDALRLRVTPTPTGWQQRIVGPDDAAIVTTIDLASLPPDEQLTAITAAAAELQASLDLSAGPLLRVAAFDLGPGQPARLLLVIHHLAVDGVSWRILLADLEASYRQLSQGSAVVLPAKTTSFKAWAERVTAYAQSAALHDELAYWRAAARFPVAPMPVDRADGANTVASVERIELVLSADDTSRLLHEVPRVYHTRINDVLLAALALAWAQWAQSPVLRLDLEGHGREDLFDEVDLSRTVGWFTSIFPVR
ncbi:MAG TPA: amino acid adenylation domain-containing protein, partial [Herpetosiphonaceae bacterium]